MTTTLQSHGGGAQPTSIDASGKVTGGTALRVYGFDTPEAAHAAGYVCEGGPAMSVALITGAQLASGAWKAEGDPSATVIYTAPSGTPVEGGYAMPVYPVNGWGSAPIPPAPVALLDLEADTLVLSDGDPVSTWPDQSGNGYDFTQTGDARPTKQTIGGYPAVTFDSIDDSLIGSNALADNFDSLTVFMVRQTSGVGDIRNPVLSKMSDYSSGAGWMILQSGFNIVTQEEGGSVYYERDFSATGHDDKAVFTYVFLSRNNFSLYINGALQTPINNVDQGPVVNTSTTEPVRINVDGSSSDGYGNLSNYAIRIYAGVFDDAGRAAIEAELAARYGITL